MTTAPAACASRAAAAAVFTGISNWVNNTSQPAMAARAALPASVRWPLEPGATTMVFSALESTTMIAVPLGPGRLTVPSSATPLASR